MVRFLWIRRYIILIKLVEKNTQILKRIQADTHLCLLNFLPTYSASASFWTLAIHVPNDPIKCQSNVNNMNRFFKKIYSSFFNLYTVNDFSNCVLLKDPDFKGKSFIHPPPYQYQMQRPSWPVFSLAFLAAGSPLWPSLTAFGWDLACWTASTLTVVPPVAEFSGSWITSRTTYCCPSWPSTAIIFCSTPVPTGAPSSVSEGSRSSSESS